MTTTELARFQGIHEWFIKPCQRELKVIEGKNKHIPLKIYVQKGDEKLIAIHQVGLEKNFAKPFRLIVSGISSP